MYRKFDISIFIFIHTLDSDSPPPLCVNVAGSLFPAAGYDPPANQSVGEGRQANHRTVFQGLSSVLFVCCD